MLGNIGKLFGNSPKTICNGNGISGTKNQIEEPQVEEEKFPTNISHTTQSPKVDRNKMLQTRQSLLNESQTLQNNQVAEWVIQEEDNIDDWQIIDPIEMKEEEPHDALITLSTEKLSLVPSTRQNLLESSNSLLAGNSVIFTPKNFNEFKEGLMHLFGREDLIFNFTEMKGVLSAQTALEFNYEALIQLPGNICISWDNSNMGSRKAGTCMLLKVNNNIIYIKNGSELREFRMMTQGSDGIIHELSIKPTKFQIDEFFAFFFVQCNPVKNRYLNKYSQPTMEERLNKLYDDHGKEMICDLIYKIRLNSVNEKIQHKSSQLNEEIVYVNYYSGGQYYVNRLQAIQSELDELKASLKELEVIEKLKSSNLESYMAAIDSLFERLDLDEQNLIINEIRAILDPIEQLKQVSHNTHGITHGSVEHPDLKIYDLIYLELNKLNQPVELEYVEIRRDNDPLLYIAEIDCQFAKLNNEQQKPIIDKIMSKHSEQKICQALDEAFNVPVLLFAKAIGRPAPRIILRALSQRLVENGRLVEGDYFDRRLQQEVLSTYRPLINTNLLTDVTP